MKLETEHLILYPLTDTLIGQILNNEITAQNAVDNMAKTINSALEKYNKSNN